ncbi:hypothetical protein [Frigoribacterium sp. CG_9.8]|uniref:hypothetical protein n=1 Tax=Frigoribacterium sp. CG_9.8 TaxID=2787733 RepID=UPI0018CB1C62|nr:hypothetical protein [Frigoribacterium sp. CG_9.8]MBG6108322.1 hypothetical protein [Frigoribacterium sp. CG_9.8]
MPPESFDGPSAAATTANSTESATAPAAGATFVAADDLSALLPRLRVIEDQPLEARASAFVQIHDRLQATLDGSVREGNRNGGGEPSRTHD